MANKIDKQTMLDLIVEAKRTDPETGSFAEWLAEYLAEHLSILTPATEVVDVVRCRHCKHYANYGRVWDCQKYGCMSLPNEDDFCSYGERKK